MTVPIGVMIVDDSAFLRHILAKHLEGYPDISVIGSAIDGADALAKIPELKPDVVVLDVEMPRMDGLTALQRIMTDCCPTPVVMLSAHTQRGARVTIQALMRGAVDFVPKPDATLNIKDVVDELVAKIRIAAGTSLPSLSPALKGPPELAAKLGPGMFRRGDPVVVIGASTGGPRALQQVLSELPADLPAAVALVQHMPAGFTQSLAQRLNDRSPLTVREASEGEQLARGLALMAPGDHHMRFGSGKHVLLDQGPRCNHVRPSVDVTMKSAVERYGKAVIGVVLTGMGADGKEGAAHIKAAGGQVIAEDSSTCVVYGMPRSVVEAGLADHVVPLPKVAALLAKLTS
ncbi:MAG: chemotaxis response regulator protein-glutamate methylesterase [Thermoflexales bacterium]|nr:chemotaxis response regulator protein-glutamate methylesterase [Thermoflexales bacterium]